MKSYPFFFLLLFNVVFMSDIIAQKYSISGHIVDKSTGENLIGANILIKEISKGAITNQYGAYSLSIEKGEYTVIASFLGFQDFNTSVKLNSDLKLNIQLTETSYTTKEVEISSERTANVTSTEMSTVRLPIEKIKIIPAFMGEIDILKTIQLLPGVQSAGEGNAGFYVRGGGPDQNLIMLDEATVYNASHLMGFFSVFNSDAVKDVNLIKGGMPANYGGRLSSVLDISMKDGNMKKFVAEGGIGLIASRLMLEGPIKKDTCSYLFTARRTYADIVVEPFVKKTAKAKGSNYYFYDLNAKLNYKFSDKDRLYLSGYYGRDVFTYKRKDQNFNVTIPWGNGTASLRWNHLFNDKLFVNTTAIFSDYQFEFKAVQQDYDLTMFSGITDYNLKTDFTYFPTIRHNVKFGVNYIFHTFVPSSATARINNTNFDTGDIIKEYAHDFSIYVNDDFDITEKLKVSFGLRATAFQHIGPFTRFVKNGNDLNIDTLYYKKGEEVAFFKHLEPRFSMRYTLSRNSSFKASFTQNYQYIHLATISSVSMPTDLWIPSSDKIEPQFGTQYAIGYFRNFKENMFETSIELYFKELENQIEYKDGSLPMNNFGDNADNYFTFGKGYSYGLELFLKKALGNTNGWIGYTLSKTYRQFDDVNNGVEFPAKYDRRHDLSFIISHKYNERWTFSAVFVYATGNALTLPVSRYFIDGKVVNEYGEKNSFRMKPYNRLDISITYYVKKTKRIESSWNFSVFNVYNRHNPYFIYFTWDGNLQEGTFKTKAMQVSLFPVLPSITWNFKF